MEAPETELKPSKVGRAPFQYSLRTMFILMTVLAVALSGIYAGPPWVSMLTGLALGLLAPIVLAIGIIYGRGYARTFCIGGMFPAGLILIALMPAYVDFIDDIWGDDPTSGETPWRVGLSIFAGAVTIVVSGLVAVGVRWMIEAPRRQQEWEALLREQFLRQQAQQASGPAAPTPPES